MIWLTGKDSVLETLPVLEKQLHYEQINTKENPIFTIGRIKKKTQKNAKEINNYLDTIQRSFLSILLFICEGRFIRCVWISKHI